MKTQNIKGNRLFVVGANEGLRAQFNSSNVRIEVQNVDVMERSDAVQRLLISFSRFAASAFSAHFLIIV